MFYDHNFLQFLSIFGEKIGVFFKNQCYDQKTPFFRKIFQRKYLKIITLVPGNKGRNFLLLTGRRGREGGRVQRIEESGPFQTEGRTVFVEQSSTI
jgi:hypothetical protein